jgi:predicted transcriptional regulator
MKHDKTRIAISIPADVVARVDQIAEAEERSRSWSELHTG